jgi:FecR protein
MRKHALIFAGLLLVVTSALSGVAHAAKAVGEVTHLSGTLIAKRADGTTTLYSVKSEVEEGDTLATEKDTYARIKFVDGGEVVLRPNSQLKVVAYSFKRDKPKEDNVFLSMLKGGMRAVTGLIGKRNHDAVKYDAVTATIGIRGTHFGALLCQSTGAGANDCADIPTASGKPPEIGLHVDVADGSIVVTNDVGQLVISAGQFGFIRNINTLPVIVPPSQGIRVTMPISISQNKSSGRGIGKANSNECTVQ